jgi:hypothetical protein
LRAELTNLVLAIKQRNHEGTSGRLGKYDEFRQKWIKKTAIPMTESGKLITEADLKFLKLPEDRLLNPAQKKELDKWMEFKNKGKDKTPAAEKEQQTTLLAWIQKEGGGQIGKVKVKSGTGTKYRVDFGKYQAKVRSSINVK